MMRKGFTLLELIIVIGIISTLIALESFVFVNSQKNARDGRRKADLENIRAAVEQYRSNNNSYPQNSRVVFATSCTTNGSLQDTAVPPNIYINPLPSDPRCQVYSYYYTALPSGCVEPACIDYVVGATLENAVGTCVPATDCQNTGSVACEYCLGPYGKK